MVPNEVPGPTSERIQKNKVSLENFKTLVVKINGH